jgi:hypothetical protein
VERILFDIVVGALAIFAIRERSLNGMVPAMALYPAIPGPRPVDSKSADKAVAG